MTGLATGGVRKRGATWWLRYRVEGERYEESAYTGDERQARALLAQRRREIREGTWRPPAAREGALRVEEARRALARAIDAAPEAAPLTVKAYLAAWIKRRREAGVRKVHDEERYFTVHVEPAIGKHALAEVTRVEIRDLMTKVGEYTSETTKKRLAPRTVLHVYRTLATAFADARDDGLIPATPCTLRTRRGELPVKRDSDPTWRAEAVYTREELEKLISNEKIAIDRRVYYALLGLAGLRSSEAASIAWRSYDAAARPLGRLVVATQAESGLKTRETKTGETREVPVHPTLAALLAEWKLRGFPLQFGGRPRPDDPIVPARSSTRDAVRMRSKKMHERLVEDLETLELRDVPSPRHALRATFLSRLEIDGANMAIARRATHAAPTDVVGGYVRVRWDDVCREIGKLQVQLRPTLAKVIALPVARVASGAGGGTSGDNLGDNRPLRAAFSRKSERGGRDLNPRPPA